MRSSGSRVTCGNAASVSRPAARFHGSACPTHTMSAPASTSPRASAWPTAVRPSVTRTLRNFGSQVISRNCLSSAMFDTSFSGKPTSTAIPALSRRASTRTRAGGAATSPCRCTTTVGPASSRTIPRRHGSRSRKNTSWLWASRVSAISSPAPDCRRHGSAVARQRTQASRGGYCVVPQTAQTCSSNRPSAAPAVRPSATRLRCQGGSTGSRVRSTGFFRAGRAMGSVMPRHPPALRRRCTARGRS